MNEGLSRLVAGLLAQSKGGEDLSSGISRVRTLIKKVIEGEDTIFGKFHSLVESFRDVIPEESQRYQAAIKALSTTSKLSRQEIVAAVNNQLEELKILEKLLISALPGRSEDRKALEARSQKMRSEMSRLRDKIAQLEKEEKEIANSMAGQEKGTAVLEKAMREVFADLRAEITSVKEKIEEQRVQGAAQQQSSVQAPVSHQLSSRQAAKPQKICPLCGAPMSFSTSGEKWQCFSCAFEELENDKVQSENRGSGPDTIYPETAPSSEPKKKCRMCGGCMDYYLGERKWQCFSCAYEEAGKDKVQSKKNLTSEADIFRQEREAREERQQPEKTEVSGAKTPGRGEPDKDSIFPEPAPAVKPNRNKDEPTTTPVPVQGAELKQKCSMCGGHLDYYAAEAKWQCYSCGFEYFKKNEGQGKSEEKHSVTQKTHPHPVLPFEREGVADKDRSNALLAIPTSESLFDLSSTTKSSPGYWEPKKGPSSFKKPAPAATKKCPSCGNKMLSCGSEKGWECRYCGYERRI